jgi:hypothetical protein
MPMEAAFAASIFVVRSNAYNITRGVKISTPIIIAEIILVSFHHQVFQLSNPTSVLLASCQLQEVRTRPWPWERPWAEAVNRVN